MNLLVIYRNHNIKLRSLISRYKISHFQVSHEIYVTTCDAALNIIMYTYHINLSLQEIICAHSNYLFWSLNFKFISSFHMYPLLEVFLFGRRVSSGDLVMVSSGAPNNFNFYHTKKLSFKDIKTFHGCIKTSIHLQYR